MTMTFEPSLSYSKYLETLCTKKKMAAKNNAIKAKVNIGLEVKCLKELNNIVDTIANTTSMKYTDTIIFLTLELLVLMCLFYDI